MDNKQKIFSMTNIFSIQNKVNKNIYLYKKYYFYLMTDFKNTKAKPIFLFIKHKSHVI